LRLFVVVQEHPEGGKNVSFSTEESPNTEDMLVPGPGWDEGKVTSGWIGVLGSTDLIQSIGMGEFRSVNNCTEDPPLVEFAA